MAVINTNSLSLVAQNNLNKSQGALGTAIERLSSGMRINNAKDDAAGQAIANRMTAQVRGMTQAARNANDGISLAQTAEGNLNEINNNLQRIRELAVQASNDPNQDSDRTSIGEEIKARLEEIDRIAGAAEFNGTKLLNSGTKDIQIQVGANTSSNDVIKISSSSLINATASKLVSTVTGAASASKASQLVKDHAAAKGLITAIDSALSKVDSARSNLGALQNRFESTISNLNNTINNVSAARSRIEDADYAVEVSNMTRAQILQQAGTSVLAQANQVPQSVLSLLG